MRIDRRHFIGIGMAAAGAAALRPGPAARPGARARTEADDRRGRADQRRRASRPDRPRPGADAANGLSALLIEPGSSMTYFTGVQWWRSERLTA